MHVLFKSKLHLYLFLSCKVCVLQNGPRWQHGISDSTWSQAEDTAGTSGCGAFVNPLSPDIQGNPQIRPLQLHGAVRCFAPRSMDHLFYGRKVKIRLTVEGRTSLFLDLELINEVDQADLLGICGLCSSYKLLMSLHTKKKQLEWSSLLLYLIHTLQQSSQLFFCIFLII